MANFRDIWNDRMQNIFDKHIKGSAVEISISSLQDAPTTN